MTSMKTGLTIAGSDCSGGRNPGGHQDNDDKRSLCDERDHGADGTEYNRST